MKNDSNPIIRSQEVTIDMHICAALSESRGSGEIYFAAIAPDMELTVITLDEAPDINNTTLRTLPLIRQGSRGLFCLLLSLYSEQHFRRFQFVWQSCFPVPA